MQSSYWGYWLVLMGVAIVGLMISVNGLTTTSTQDHYAVREVVEASMLESVDYAYYRDYNEIKMNKEKFMEVFTRMLAENMSSTDTYQINFYEMYEAPPKVSVEVKSHSGTNFISTSDYDVTTRVDAIIQIHAESVGSNSSISNNNSNQNNNNNQNNNSNNNSNAGSSGGNTQTGGTAIPTNACKDGIETSTLKGMHGVAMVAANVYETSDMKKKTTSLASGTKFQILGEKGSGEKYWAIELNGSCGWVDSGSMAINLKEYAPEIRYEIKNASSSIFKTYDGTSEVNIPKVTGQKLYNNEFSSFVPGTYSFAKKLKQAAANAKNGGDTLVVYDAYRPAAVTSYVYSNFKALVDSNSKVKQNITYDSNGTRWGEGWFLARNVSKHNTGCAVDVAISGYSVVPSAMHQLSTLAVKYTQAKYGATKFSPGMEKSSGAKKLHNYMTSAGLGDLPSEWWHFQDNQCTVNAPATFWSNV